jgi:hypothetical protein
MNSRANKLNEMMQDRFGFHLNEEYRNKPVTNDTLNFALQQLLCAVAVGLSHVEKTILVALEQRDTPSE